MKIDFNLTNLLSTLFASVTYLLIRTSCNQKDKTWFSVFTDFLLGALWLFIPISLAFTECI